MDCDNCISKIALRTARDRRPRSLLPRLYDIPPPRGGNGKTDRNQPAMSRMLPPRLIVPLLAIALCIACTAGAGGCGRAKARRDDPVHVLATVYAMADIAKQVGGEFVTTEWYVEDGQSLEELVETPERRQQFRSAELVVTRGAPDGWTLEGAGDAYQDRKILRLDTLPSTKDADPLMYLWLDPRTAIEVADEIATRLSALRPRHEKQFKANAA